MKLLYIANARIPSEKAHVYQILKMCEAFQKAGIDVELIVPIRFEMQRSMKHIKNIWEYYPLNKRFKIKRLPSVDFMWTYQYYPRMTWLMAIVFLLQDRSFGIFASLYALVSRSGIIYTRDPFVSFLISILNVFHHKKIFLELHKFSLPYGRKISVWALSRIDGIVVTNRKLKELYVQNGIPKENLLVAANGFDPELFTPKLSQIEARREMAIPEKKKIICYTGHLYEWKGVHILAHSKKYLSDDYLVYIVGGTEQDIAKFRKFLVDEKIEGVVLTGYKAPSLVPKYLAASDVVVLPNTAKETISREYTSPIKLFEYMASRRPIVASDLPSLTEILGKQNAVLVVPDDARALAKGIQKVLQNQELGVRITIKAYQEVQKYTWGKRAKKILTFISNEHDGT